MSEVMTRYSNAKVIVITYEPAVALLFSTNRLVADPVHCCSCKLDVPLSYLLHQPLPNTTAVIRSTDQPPGLKIVVTPPDNVLSDTSFRPTIVTRQRNPSTFRNM